MNQGTSVFSQILSLIDYKRFSPLRSHATMGIAVCVVCPVGNSFLAMAFAQLTRRESLRDIEVSLAAHRRQLYHAGFRSPVKTVHTGRCE